MSKYKTKQRSILLNFFKENSHTNYTASEIFTNLKSKNISLSAIYRNLIDLENSDIIEKIIDSNNNISYTFIHDVDCDNLFHLMCMTCNKTFHAPMEFTNSLKKYQLSTQFEVNLNKSILYGTCVNCKNKSKKENI